MSPAVITILVTIGFAVLLFSGKFSFGLVAMTAAFTLIATGVLDLQTGLAGMTSNTVVMVASMMVMAAALRKTNIPYVLSKALGRIGGKKDMLLAISVFAVLVIMELFLGFIVSSILILSILQTLPKESKVNSYRMLFPMMMLGSLWEHTFPVGMGATTDMMTNSFAKGVVTDPAMQLVFLDSFKAKLLPVAVLFVFCCIIWKFIPDGEVEMGEHAVGEIKKSELPKWKEILVYVLFVLTFVAMIFSKVFGSMMYVIPAVSVLIFSYTHILDRKEIMANVAGNVTWLLIGIQAVTSALTASGATAIIGQFLSPLFTWTSNGFLVLIMVGMVTMLMTSFLSNVGTWAVLTPLVAAAAVSAGLNPRPMMLMVGSCCTIAFMVPSGSANTGMVFSMGHYSPAKMLKFTLPASILTVLVTAVSVMIVAPF